MLHNSVEDMYKAELDKDLWENYWPVREEKVINLKPWEGGEGD